MRASGDEADPTGLTLADLDVGQRVGRNDVHLALVVGEAQELGVGGEGVRDDLLDLGGGLRALEGELAGGVGDTDANVHVLSVDDADARHPGRSPWAEPARGCRARGGGCGVAAARYGSRMPDTRFAVDAPEEVRALELDSSQAAVLALPDDASAAVLGAPGTGKTTTLVELVAHRVARGWAPEQLLVLAPSRASAARLRDRLARRIGVPTDGPLARTVASLAYEVVGAAARLAGHPAPRLLTGTEQDADIAAYLAGHIADGTGPDWPEPLTPEVRELRGFRSELREFMARATEYGADADRVAELAREAGRADWAAAAAFMREYAATQAQNRPEQFDAAEIVSFAVRAIREGGDDDRISRLRLVLVDDLQEATESTMAVLRALLDRGVAVIAFGDPDVAANAFRGGEADVVGRFAASLGIADGDRLVLETVHRGGPELRALVARTVERIGTAAA